MNKEIKIQGLKIRYKTAGKGVPVLMLHGWGGSSDSWEEVIEILGKNNFQVFCPDLPGFGKSEDPKEPWKINNYISFLLDFIKKMQIDEFYLIGHSFGGGISTKLASEHPQIVKRVILCDAAIVRAKKRLSFRQKVAKTSSKLAKPLLKTNVFEEKIKPKLQPIIYKIAGNYDYYHANDTMKQTFKQITEEDLRPFASYIKKPTLVVWGENDTTTPTEDAWALKNIIETAEVRIIKNVAHSPHLKAPKELSSVIIDFLNKEI